MKKPPYKPKVLYNGTCYRIRFVLDFSFQKTGWLQCSKTSLIHWLPNVETTGWPDSGNVCAAGCVVHKGQLSLTRRHLHPDVERVVNRHK